MDKKKGNRLAFEKDLLRLPGQSLDEELDVLINEKGSSYLVVIFLSFAFILISWVNWIWPLVWNPYIVTITSLPAIVYSIIQIRRILKEARNLRQGRNGERFVGQLLEKLRADGFTVYHDVKSENFNIDHVLIGTKGIFIVETKTWNKNSEGGTIEYKDKQFILNGKPIEKDPVIQARSAAKFISNLLLESTGKKFSVEPIIAAPSWFITPEKSAEIRKEGVFLCNPINLSSFMSKRKETVPKEDVSLTTFHLGLYIKWNDI